RRGIEREAAQAYTIADGQLRNAEIDVEPLGLDVPRHVGVAVEAHASDVVSVVRSIIRAVAPDGVELEAEHAAQVIAGDGIEVHAPAGAPHELTILARHISVTATSRRRHVQLPVRESGVDKPCHPQLRGPRRDGRQSNHHQEQDISTWILHRRCLLSGCLGLYFAVCYLPYPQLLN